MNAAKFYLILGMLFSVVFLMGAKDIPLIEPQVENGIRYISGGVGKGERDAMMEAFSAKDFNLKVVFAAQTGQYLSSIPVRIMDSDGKTLIETESSGPWFFVDLPAGKYRITAVHDGREKIQEVAVNGGMDTLRFYWKYEGELQTRTKRQG